jgi:N-hydroxyarylamine O-acetyltransferase
MKNATFAIDAYMERIGYTGGLTPCDDTLRGLHQAHTLSIPFENFDAYFHGNVNLELPFLFRKIVSRGRGGYCFEMNGLFAAVLETLGFKVRPLLARVGIDFKRAFGPRTHQVLLVEVSGERWLADVGFGKDGLIEPILLDTREAQRQFSRTYRLDHDPDHGYVLEFLTSRTTRCEYAFTLEACCHADFLMSNHDTSTHPASLFVNRLVCTMPTLEGRITLTDQHLKVDSSSGTEVTPVRGEAGFEAMLMEHFGLDLGEVKAGGLCDV